MFAVAMSIALFVAGWFGVFDTNDTQGYGSAATRGTPACATASSTTFAVGKDLSSVIIGTTSARAFGKLMLFPNATNTVYVAFDGKTATVANGFPIFTTGSPTASSSEVAFLEFGLDTDFPYTGAISVISNNGSTTLNAINCAY